jgi:hypothetical protein
MRFKRIGSIRQCRKCESHNPIFIGFKNCISVRAPNLLPNAGIVKPFLRQFREPFAHRIVIRGKPVLTTFGYMAFSFIFT